MPVPPKPASKRRRRNVPKTYGAAEPTVAPAANGDVRTLRIDGPVHSMVERMWAALQSSAEARFYSEADWARVQLELWHANVVLSGDRISPTAWQAVQHGLTELLISPAAKRRAAIELKPVGPDTDADAAVLQMVKYQDKLQSIKPE
jgi:hypothetical protein